MDIRFNYFTRSTKGGETCAVLRIDQIQPAQNNDKGPLTPCIQTYDCGFRRDVTNGDYSSWNGCIFIDIDSKKFPGAFPYEQFSSTLTRCLEGLYPQHYYWHQTSASGNSLHVCLYFDCERNETNFKKCCNLGKEIMLDAAQKCGENYLKILTAPDVLDDCTSRVGQPLFISAHPIIMSELLCELTGECNLDGVKLDENTFSEQEVSFCSNAKYKVKPNLEELPDYNYPSTRWPLCWIIFNYFNFDYDKCREVWDKVIPLILSNRSDYTKPRLSQQFKRDFKASQGKQYPFKPVLLEWARRNLGFEYTIKREFEPKVMDLYQADEEYTLKEGEYLSHIDIRFRQGFNHIFAGCGVGKTRFAIEYGMKKRVCFISPMTSINRNSFGGVEQKWLIVDGKHKDEVLHVCGSVENALGGTGRIVDPFDVEEALANPGWSICTTWESFSNYEMYKYPFDAFILDESHTMYMYDYRIESIRNLKRSLAQANGEVILMSGTPSFEIQEFNCHKIKINKEAVHVPCDIVFYNNTWEGYVYKDISDWISADKDNLALLFYDITNYKVEEKFKCYGIDADIFNKNYSDTTDWILEHENVRKEVTAFSVYGQAGINLHLDSDKRARLYILTENALSIVQYANRVRNKEVIDKVVIPFMAEHIDNRIRPVNEEVDYDGALKKVEMINSVRLRNDDFMNNPMKFDQLVRMRFGMPLNVLNTNDLGVELSIPRYETWCRIRNVIKYESQIQLVYNRLVSNQFDVNLVYLDADVKHRKSTNMRSNQFAGQMVKFDFDAMVRAKKDLSSLYLVPTANFAKVAVGDTIDTITDILNHYWTETRDLDQVRDKFCEMVRTVVRQTGTIRKSDLKRHSEFLRISKNFDTFIDNAFLVAFLNSQIDEAQATAAYVRYVWNDKLDWKKAADETYGRMGELKDIVTNHSGCFADMAGRAEPLSLSPDPTMQMIYEYVVKRFRKKSGKGITVNGVRYDSERDAAARLGKSKSWVHRNKE